jgi:hypothetical protein
MESIITSCKNNSLPDLHRYIHVISRDRDEYVNKLGEAITLLHKNDASRDIVTSVMSQWDMSDGAPDNSFITAAENFVCSNEDLRFLVKRLETLSDIRYMINQVMDNISFGQVMNRLLYAYEDRMTNDDLLDLKEHMDVYESKTKRKFPSVMSYIERNMKLKARKPDYVSIKEGETKAYLKNVSMGLDMEQKEVFMSQMIYESKKLNIKGDMSKFIDMFASSMSDIVDKDNSFDKSFRVWGPENRFKTRDCSGNPEGKGPCRMFTCLCRDSEENDGEIMNDWFSGKCDHCNRRIVDVSHAVRYPHKDGGWKGCYCCFYCVSQLPPYQTNKEDNVRMKRIEAKIKDIGIMDRSLL